MYDLTNFLERYAFLSNTTLATTRPPARTDRDERVGDIIDAVWWCFGLGGLGLVVEECGGRESRRSSFVRPGTDAIGLFKLSI
jgi:hypothetical protein